jgi:hypothetical protein
MIKRKNKLQNYEKKRKVEGKRTTETDTQCVPIWRMFCCKELQQQQQQQKGNALLFFWKSIRFDNNADAADHVRA